MKTVYKAALGLSTLSVDGKVTRGEFILNSMQTSGNFTDTPVSYTESTGVTNDLHNASVAAASGATGLISAMHGYERVFTDTFNFIRSYVERKANKSTDPKSIIESAGMVAYTITGNSGVTDITLTATGNGSIKVQVPRNAGEVAFIYQYSTDGGATWIEFAISKMATVEIPNQTPASIIHVRYAAITKSKDAFSQAKTIIVL
jgi:hypothetical protein